MEESHTKKLERVPEKHCEMKTVLDQANVLWQLNIRGNVASVNTHHSSTKLSSSRLKTKIHLHVNIAYNT
jgi:hypothetical protein